MLCSMVSTAETSGEDVPLPLNSSTVGDVLARIPACAGATESCCVERPDWFGIPQPIKLIDAINTTLKLKMFRKDFAVGGKCKRTSFSTCNWVLGWRSTEPPTQLISLGRIIADAMVDSSPQECVEKNTLVHKVRH